MKNYSKKTREKIDKEMARFKPLPKGYSKWADNLFKDFNFIAFKPKEEKAYCTRCKTEFEKPKGYKHNHFAKCPCCHKELKLINTNIRKYGHESDVRWGAILTANNDDLLLQYVNTSVFYSSDFRTRTVYYTELVRGVVSKKGQRLYEYNEWDKVWENYSDYKAMRPKTNNYAPTKRFIYTKDINKVLKNTWAKYSGLSEMIKAINKLKTSDSYFIPEYKYFWAYRDNPNIEKLAKLGLSELVYAFYEVKEDTVYKMLGVTKPQLKLILEFGNPNKNIVEMFKTLPNLKIDEYRAIFQRKYLQWDNWYSTRNEFDFVAEMLQHTTAHKLLKYFDSMNGTLDLYKDYWGFCKALNRDLDDEFVLFPRQLMQAHDDLLDIINREKAEKKRKEIAEKDAKYKEMLDNIKARFGENIKASTLRICGLFIRLPENLAELSKEGDFLHHCVGGYANRVARGETQIFFIRKESEPLTPYYTLEWKDNHVVQCRGMRNCDMTDEVKEFVESFTALMRKPQAVKAA